MPMPTAHKQQISTLSKELRALNKVIRDPQFRAALDEFHDNPTARASASKNGNRYLKRKGVDLPEGVIVTMKDNNWRVSICVLLVGCVHYDSHDGWGRGS